MRRTFLAILGVLAIVPASAGATHVSTVVNFEGIPQFTPIADQYAGQGVLFGSPARFGLPIPSTSCSGGGDARSGGIAGTSANIACATGPSEFPDRRFATAFEFDVERRQISFRIESRVASSGSLPATMRVYGIGGALREERPLTLVRNTPLTVNVARGIPDVAAIVVFGALDPNDSGTVLIDDLVSPLDDVPPPAKWSLALSTPSIEIVEGATATANVSIRRFNGSTGPVSLSVPDLPPGITATLIEPNPTTGRDPVQLRVTAARPMTGPRQITVDASGGGSAGTGIVTQGVQTVTGVPAVQIASGGRFTRTVVPGCGPQRFEESFSVRGGLSTNVTLAPAVFNPGLTVSASPANVATAGDGSYPYGLVLDPGATSGIQTVRLRAFPGGATPADLDVFFRVDPVTVAAVAPASFARPSLGSTGRVTVRGNFPASCGIKFQDGQGQDWRILQRDSAEVDGRYFDLWTLEVPANAASGPLRVLSPANAELARTAPLDIREFRNTFGFSQGNSGPGARTASYTWADFERTFGTDDTEACFVFCVRDPIAADYYDTFRSQVTANPGNGLCAGWATMALRFSQFLGEQRPSDYQPGVQRAWQITPASDGTPIKRDVVRWHVAQFDKFFQQARARGFARSPADERALLREASRVGGLYVSIRQGASGHAVVAHQVQDITTPTGPGLTVAIYDPNQPYATAEETSGPFRTAALANSTITIQGDGSWSGASFPWSGNNGTLGVIDPLPSTDAKLPSDFSLASLLGSADGAPPAQVATITSQGRQVLDGSGEPQQGSGVVLQPAMSGAGPVPQYRLTEGQRYTFGLRGASAGRYTHSVIGNGASASVDGASIAPGAADELTVRAGGAELDFRSAGGSSVTYRVAEDRGRATRTATIVTKAGRGGGDEVELAGGALQVRHAGPPASASITLGSVGEGLPGAVTTAPVRLGDRQRLTLSPSSWKDLAAGVRITVRDRSGRVVRRGRVALRTTRRIGLTKVRARRSGRKITLSGRVTRAGGAPVLAAVVEQLRGSRTVSRTTVTRRGAQVRSGAFSLPVTIRRRAGTRLRATVTLVDEAADLVSVRRRVAVR